MKVHRVQIASAWGYLAWYDVGEPLRESDAIRAGRVWVSVSPYADAQSAYVEAVRVVRGASVVWFAPVGSSVRSDLVVTLPGAGQGAWSIVVPDVPLFAGDILQVYGRSSGDVAASVTIEGEPLSATIAPDAPLCGLSPGLPPAKDLLDRLRQVSGAAWRLLPPLGARVRLNVRRKTW